ncbi:MAG: MerR family transcriptional regulator, partial [Actinomycetota bacterium]|nr:MerR family transcriptional regulator [Actinomycetota bacterium]
MEPMQSKDNMKTLMPIAAVSSLLGIPVPTIRSWERRYGFPVPARTHGKHRRYAVDQVDGLRMMRDAITRGHSASEAVDIARRHTTEAGPRSELLDRFLDTAMRLDPAG